MIKKLLLILLFTATAFGGGNVEIDNGVLKIFTADGANVMQLYRDNIQSFMDWTIPSGDNTLFLTGGPVDLDSLIGVGSISGSDLDISAGTGDYTSTGDITLSGTGTLQAITITDGTASLTGGIGTGYTLTAPDINGGTVDAITSLTVANSVDIGNFTLTANGLTIDGTFTDGTATIVGGLGTFGNIIDNGLTASLAVYTDASKQLTSTAPATGIIGYWSRSGTVITTATAGDDLTITGDITIDAVADAVFTLESLAGQGRCYEIMSTGSNLDILGGNPAGSGLVRFGENSGGIPDAVTIDLGTGETTINSTDIDALLLTREGNVGIRFQEDDGVDITGDFRIYVKGNDWLVRDVLNAADRMRINQDGKMNLFDNDFQTTGTGTFGTITDGTTTITAGNYTGVGNITGTDVDISAGTGDYSSTGNLTIGGNAIIGDAAGDTTDIFGITQIGDGGTTNYTQVNATGDITQAGSAEVIYTKYTAGAVDVTGFTEVGQNDAWLQSHDDGTVFTATEVAGGNNDVTVNFTSVTAFNWVQVLFRYEGSASHHICVQLEVTPFDGSAWETFFTIKDQPANECNDNASFIIAKASSTYINSGAVKVRLLHTATTVNNHLLVIDEVALYQ